MDNNYLCGGCHELNMTAFWEWDVMEVNGERQPVIEAAAAWPAELIPDLVMWLVAHQWQEFFSPQSQHSWENWFLIWAVFDSFRNQKLKWTHLCPVITKEQK